VSDRTPPALPRQRIGGGARKVLYTLNTVRRIGLLDSSKALRANNTCKACGLGMGGQQGGMTNELGEFPAVCNKSIQAQSTDIQPPIPAQIFDHPVSELCELSNRELEQLGRLTVPLRKDPKSDRFRPIGWDEALALAAGWLRETAPNRSFFYASGRSSNEAAFLFQLIARLYGTNNVNNCSYYCHQATSVALGNTIGTGTATVELADLGRCDQLFVIGANPASNHPRFIHQLERLRARGGQVIVINPAREPGLVRFAVPSSARSMLRGGTPIATHYLQPRIGGDIALFKGLAKAVLAQGTRDDAFIRTHTTQFVDLERDLARLSWASIEQAAGVSRQDIEAVAAVYGAATNAVFAWGMGMTHHQHGVANIEAISNVALLRGMIGRPGAGLLPLRGHSNVQGIGTVGVKPVLGSEVMARLQSELGVTLPRQEGMDTLACMSAAAEGGIDAAVMMGGNLYAGTPNTRWADAALSRVQRRIFLTTTLNSGHVNGCDDGASLILPVTARDEEWESTTQESMFNYVRLSDGGIRRHEGTRPESWVLARIARALLPNASFDFDRFASHQNLRQAIAATVPGMEALEDIDVARKEFVVRNRTLHTPAFNTPGGRARFAVTPLPAIGETAEYPLRLASVRSEGQFNSMIYEEADSYRGTRSRWSVLVSPELIDRLQLGPRANLVSAHGRMDGLQVHPFPLAKDSVLAYYPEANVLIGTRADRRSKTPAFKSVPVRLEPCLS
jgi:molybdopterin-dependent oxidoreductase alpha subunit